MVGRPPKVRRRHWVGCVSRELEHFEHLKNVDITLYVVWITLIYTFNVVNIERHWYSTERLWILQQVFKAFYLRRLTRSGLLYNIFSCFSDVSVELWFVMLDGLYVIYVVCFSAGSVHTKFATNGRLPPPPVIVQGPQSLMHLSKSAAAFLSGSVSFMKLCFILRIFQWV